MAHLWVQQAAQWRTQQLTESVVALASLKPAAEMSLFADAEPTGTDAALLVRSGAGGTHAWALIAAPDSSLRVDGVSPLAGLRVLADRDEIRTASGDRYFFSTETLAEIVPFPGSERAVYCGLCRQPIERTAVLCPGCGIWFHQDAELPCWTYNDRCNFCGHATALDSGYAWTPEEEC